MNDTSKTGRWLCFNISSLEDLVIAEADRKLGDHIKALSTFNKALYSSNNKHDPKGTCPIGPNCIQFQTLSCQVLPLTELLRSLENAGEIGVSIALHNIEDSAVKVAKPCCFLLDPLKDRTLQKKVRLDQHIIKILLKMLKAPPPIQNM